MLLRSEALDLLRDYDRHHRTPGNKITHYLGIPVIVFALLGMLGRVVLIPAGVLPVPWSGGLDAGLALCLLAGVYYVRLDLRCGLGITVTAIVLYGLAGWVPFLWHLALFVVGWGLQLVGHGVYEKNQPAFAKNLQHLLIGPLWIFLRALARRAA